MTDAEANAHGIDNRETVRIGLIELRDAMLTIPRFDEALLLSHAIWWLSTDIEDADLWSGTR